MPDRNDITTSDEAEALVVGGGPAGLSAALYLARFDRSVIVLDAGQAASAANYYLYPPELKDA